MLHRPAQDGVTLTQHECIKPPGLVNIFNVQGYFLMDGCSLVSEHDEVSPPGQWQQFEDSLTIYILQRWAGVQLL